MSQAPVTDTKLDNLYLKFFKYAVVGLMTLALLAIVVLIPMAAFQYFQSPTPPTPAKAAPDRAVNLEDFKKFLIQEEKRRQELEKSGITTTSPQPQSAPAVNSIYLEQTVLLQRCSEKFAFLAKQPTPQLTEKEISDSREKRRAKIEGLATDQFRGPNWPSAMVTFVCSVLENLEIAKLKEDKTIGTVVDPAIDFHAQAWATIQQEKFEFTQREERRVQEETMAEGARVAVSKIRAVFMVSSAGGALLFFMAMALYLIFAKIEDNLALINRSIVTRTLPTANS